MFIENISASRSDVIDQCLLKYYYKYILKIPGFGNPNEESLNFGTYIHKIFEIGFVEKDYKSLSKIAENTAKEYKIPKSFLEKTKKCVENFLLFNNSLGETISTEFEYKVDLDPEHKIFANGVIDRVVKGTKGGYLVIDYKTSKREKTKKDLLMDKQLMGYAYAIHKLYGVGFNEIWCCHYYPVSNNFVCVQFNKAQIYNWKKKETDKVWRIRKKKKDEFPPQKNVFCDFCEFKPACPLYNKEDVVKCKLEEQKVLRASITSSQDGESKPQEEEKKNNDCTPG